MRFSVVSLAEKALSASVTVLLFFEDRMSGRMFWARKRFFGSCRTTNPFVSMEESVVKMFPTWIEPSFRPATVSGPPTSRGLNVPNSTS